MTLLLRGRTNYLTDHYRYWKSNTCSPARTVVLIRKVHSGKSHFASVRLSVFSDERAVILMATGRVRPEADAAYSMFKGGFRLKLWVMQARMNDCAINSPPKRSLWIRAGIVT